MTIKDDGEYYLPCSSCCDTTCIFCGTNDTHPICKDYKPMAIKALEQESVLDKIISEINEYKLSHADFTHISIKRVVAIINKYKSESEE